MSAIYHSVSSYLQKRPVEEPPSHSTAGMEVSDLPCEDTEASEQQIVDPAQMKENDSPELTSDKKTDELMEVQKPASLMWRMSSGLYSATTGAVGLGVGSVKWVAGKGYDAGSAVIGTTVNTTKTVASKVPVPSWKRKDKKE